ncbi:MAG: hypothetical protein IKV35_00290 [Clostridia bacterium]|nr:hypothetical protein [Clostridia bacterium]
MSGIRSRILSLTVALLVLILTVAGVPMSTAAASLGDVTGEGVRNMMDVMMLYRHASGSSKLTGDAQSCADITGDSVVNMMDVMMLYRVVSGQLVLPEPEPDDPVIEPDDPVVDPEPIGLTPLDPNAYYGRTLLAEESDDYVEAYDYLVEEVSALNADVALWKYSLTLPEFERVFRYVRDDHPELFWVSGAYGYMYYVGNDGLNYIYSMQQNYGCTQEEIAAQQAAIDAAADECLDGITDETPYADRVKRVHDWLVLRADYDVSHKAAYTHDMRGIMLNGTGVCESYSRSFQYLMYRCGIQTIVTGGKAASGESHMWNVLLLNGDWYQMDVTWNDPVFGSELATIMKSYIGYTYYNVTTAQIRSDRVILAEYSNFDKTYQVTYPIPNCTATAENHDLKTAVELTSFDVAVMAPAVAKSIENGEQAVFKPSGSYTMAAFQSDFANATKHWELINAVNELLPADKQLVKPGYSMTPNTAYGLWSVYLRNMA